MKPTVYREWSEKSAANAQALAEEARILLEVKRLSRAYYLAHMSTEESSKSILLYSMATSRTPASQLPKIKKLLRNHKKKIEFVVAYAASTSHELTEKLHGLQADLIAHINDLKNDSMYVSCEENAILTPEERISDIPVSNHVEAAEYLAFVANRLLTHHSTGLSLSHSQADWRYDCSETRTQLAS